MILSSLWPVTLLALQAQSSTALLDDFLDPPSISRPKFRYWLPDASAEHAIVKRDVASAASIGAGGVEFLPFYNYGGDLPFYPAGADWSTYGFGTPAFKEVFRAALEAHKENGLSMDFAFGPNQGQGVPADPHDEGLQWDLVPVKAALPSNDNWSGVIPGWGQGRLISVVSAVVLSSQNITFEDFEDLAPTNVTYEQLVLKNGTLVEHTRQVNLTTGQISLEFDDAATNDRALFAFYETQTHRKALLFPNNRTSSIFDNGSYIVDHYSAKGARTMTKFWEDNLLTEGIKELLMEVGDCSWEDSLEARSNISWSPALPTKFHETFGYSLEVHLPLIAFRQNNVGLQAAQPGAFQCLLDVDEYRIAVENDFRSVLGVAYGEYLDALRTWTNTELSLRFRTQPGYNLPLDMLQSIPHADIPELESLGFAANIDAYRQFVGPAQLAGRRIISNELGAIFNVAWKYPLSTLLFSANIAFAAGVNKMVLHGQAYTGNFYQTTWPGYTAFAHLVSENWSEKQPVWDHGMKDVMDYMARLQHVMQTGIAKTDVAIYSKFTGKNRSTEYMGEDLVRDGWSYNYLSPDNFEFVRPDVANNELSPDGPAYRALVVPTYHNLTLDAVRYLKSFAEAGLPIIFTGDVAQAWFATAGNDSEADMQRELSSLMESDNVHSIGLSEVSRQLSSLSIIPQAQPVVNGTWYTSWTQGEGIDYVFVFGFSEGSSGELIVDSTRQPYLLDLWTGSFQPLLVFQRVGSLIHIPLSLATNQTMVLGFSDDLPKPARTLESDSIPLSLLGYASSNASSTLHLAHSEHPETVKRSDGESLELDSSNVPHAFELFNWTLIAEHWEAPENMSDAETIASKRNTTHYLATLTSWLDIPELTNTSGLGYYSTSFDWPAANEILDGAYISFPPITHGLRVSVNGKKMPPLDYAHPIADISAHLQEGSNTIDVVVPSTMWNYIRSIAWTILQTGIPPVPAYYEQLYGTPMPPKVDNGLVGPVRIVPYKSVAL